MPEDPRKPTEADRLYELTPRQLDALDLILSGKRDAQVAEAVGVTRQTVNEWRRHHPAFRAALTAFLSDRLSAMGHRVAELQRDALELVGSAIEGGDAKVALGYLRLGLDVPRPQGSEEPEEVLLAELPRRDLLQEILDKDEAPTEADRKKLENRISSRIRAASSGKKEP